MVKEEKIEEEDDDNDREMKEVGWRVEALVCLGRKVKVAVCCGFTQ